MAMAQSGLVACVNARLLDPASGLDAKGGVLISGEKISAFGPDVTASSVPAGTTIIDCQGYCLAPGLVDMRVHLREPGFEHQETLQTTGRAAVAGGVTSMAGLPGTDPVIDDVATMEFVARRARKNGLAKVYCYAAATKGLQGKEMAEMGLLAEAGAVAFTDGVRAIANAKTMRRVLGYASTFGLLVIQHPEEPTLAEGGVMHESLNATRLGLPGIPAAAEALMLARDLKLVEMSGARYHAAHLSTAEGVELIRQARARGLAVTCDTAPPYFALNELAIGDYRTYAKLSPPLRSEDDRRAIVEGLRDGTIDAIVSDHAPQDQDSKRLPFAQASFGAVGLETLLALSLSLYHNGDIPLLDVLGCLTSAPAGILGLSAGKLAVGASADLVIFDPDRGWRITPERFVSTCKNSPFDGRPVQGKVLKTIIDGRAVFDGGL